MHSTSLNQTPKLLTEQVAKFYTYFPYPNYPIMARAALAQAYLTSSDFSAALCGTQLNSLKKSKEILTIGCGEMLPQLIKNWEEKFHALYFVDLSHKSLQRAKLRNLDFFSTQHHYIQADIQAYLLNQSQTYNHIDCYGVLHHLARPYETLSTISSRLKPNGTLRLMIYNSQGRTWIHRLQSAFNDLKINPFKKTDLDFARQIIAILAEKQPFFNERIPRSMLDLKQFDDNKFSDTFLHPLEQYIDFSELVENLHKQNLTVFGLFDRYGELDDLENPLWNFPNISDLLERCQDHRFENNFELFICKKDPLEQKQPLGSQFFAPQTHNVLYKLNTLYNFGLKSPKIWWSFAETNNISKQSRIEIWLAFIDYIKKRRIPAAAIYKKLPTDALQRLARLGAILPGMLDQNLVDKARQVLSLSKMQAPYRITKCEPIILPEIENLIRIKKAATGINQGPQEKILKLLGVSSTLTPL
ncbi:MAG: class I SAM-dependent methyltransferase [Oligoflexales bacterium]|nr:class I SAM-dependent methyltransferase [Oligoflexales bacterium]